MVGRIITWNGKAISVYLSPCLKAEGRKRKNPLIPRHGFLAGAFYYWRRKRETSAQGVEGETCGWNMTGKGEMASGSDKKLLACPSGGTSPATCHCTATYAHQASSGMCGPLPGQKLNNVSISPRHLCFNFLKANHACNKDTCILGGSGLPLSPSLLPPPSLPAWLPTLPPSPAQERTCCLLPQEGRKGQKEGRKEEDGGGRDRKKGGRGGRAGVAAWWAAASFPSVCSFSNMLHALTMYVSCLLCGNTIACHHNISNKLLLLLTSNKLLT